MYQLDTAAKKKRPEKRGEQKKALIEPTVSSVQ